MRGAGSRLRVTPNSLAFSRIFDRRQKSSTWQNSLPILITEYHSSLGNFGRNKNSTLVDDYPIWTEGEAALEEKMETVRRDKLVSQPSEERLDYDQSRDEPADESRLNKSCSIY